MRDYTYTQYVIYYTINKRIVGEFLDVHPHAGGAAFGLYIACKGCKGPSPRRRGSLKHVKPKSLTAGSIPTQAGQPLTHGAEISCSLKTSPRRQAYMRRVTPRRPDNMTLNPKHLAVPKAGSQSQRPCAAQCHAQYLRQSVRCWLSPNLHEKEHLVPRFPVRADGLQ